MNKSRQTSTEKSTRKRKNFEETDTAENRRQFYNEFRGIRRFDTQSSSQSSSSCAANSTRLIDTRNTENSTSKRRNFEEPDTVEKRRRFSNEFRGINFGETQSVDNTSSRRNSDAGSSTSSPKIDKDLRRKLQTRPPEIQNWNQDGGKRTKIFCRQESFAESSTNWTFSNSTDRRRGNNRGGRDRHGDNRRGRIQHGNVDNREIRPLGLRRLEQILLRQPNDVILCLIEPRSGLKECLAKPNIDFEDLCLLLKVLCRGFSTKLHPTNQNFLMGILTSSTLFHSHVTQLLFNRKLNDQKSVLSDLSAIFEAIVDKMPDTSPEHLEICVKQCTMVAKDQGDDDVLKRLEKIKTKIENLQENKDRQLREKRRNKMANWDNIDEPPEDFRQIDITPSIEEIRFTGKPFLRKNIVEGKFKDVDHYLDVHFRLLREDFIAPLRNGINNYLNRDKNSSTKKIRDIRLYENVVVLEPHYNKDGVIYTVQFDMSKFRNIKWDISRRLIFGSLVCLSDDNFKTAIFGAIACRQPDDLKSGKIKIKFEDKFQQKRELENSEKNKIYVMAESQAYFEAYKHVLKGLQHFNADNMPLQQYIVHVDRHMLPPRYLEFETVYNFSDVADIDKYQSDASSPNILNSEPGPEPGPKTGPIPETQRCVVDIRRWPSAEELGLDDSQRRAMHLALSSAVAIIQGPPGTGKTFVGLKIMKMLLTNRHVWRTKEETSPILVVCLTNHALDQFLEGILQFTNRLVRVGGRSKNERLAKYNLRYILDRLKYERLREYNIFKTSGYFQGELRLIRGKIEYGKNSIDRLRESILHETSLDKLMGNDDRLMKSLSFGFEERFEVNPHGQPWCPSSFLAVWLGLTPYIDFVSEYEVEEFYYQDTTDFQIQDRQLHEHELPNKTENLMTEEEDGKNLIDVEDQWTAINQSRQLEDGEIEEVAPELTPTITSILWSVDVNSLNDPEYFGDGMQMDDAMFDLLRQMGDMRQMIAKRELCNRDVMNDDEIAGIGNAWFLPLIDRWRLYRRWIKKFRVIIEENIKIHQEKYEMVAKQFKEVLNAEELGVLRNNDVIGLTTTGAAKYLSTLQELGPKIGDHQQLRPTLTVYQLAEKYHLDVSLFERLIKNDVPYETLQLQHRMRPEISRLLVPNIYKNLEDHPSVRRHPAIKGVKSSVFFLTHTQPEEVVSDSTTRSNPFEAEFLVGLCRYLLQQGYEPSQITILTTYAGQLFVLRRLMTRDVFEGVKVTVVDNYQGEENDIILLSFVRSNDDGNIGFLKIDNRVNVALSRAKHGMFCVGNFKFLASRSDLWRNIVTDLEKENQIGDSMPLLCQKHKNESFVSCQNDFQRLAPEGGCINQCDEKLPCGHFCTRICHVNEHTSCHQKCGKIICELNHTCPLKCYLPCDPCKIPVLKNHLNCDHKITIKCSTDIATVLCDVTVDRTLPKCNHLVKLPCHVNIDEHLCKVAVKRELPNCKHVTTMSCHRNPETITCKIPCDIRLDECGHVCPRTCHPLDDVDHENIECHKKCSKKICERGHKCEKLCYKPCNECLIFVDKELPCGHVIKHPCSKEIVVESADSAYTSTTYYLPYERVKPCTKPCKRLLTCGHQCQQKCSSPCGHCEKLVEKTFRCGHITMTFCSTEIDSIICSVPCIKMLPCGHRCMNTCGEPCSTKCNYPITRTGPCGHDVKVSCYQRDAFLQEITKHCNHPCGQLLKCQHTCRGKCGTCRQGRVHVPCTQKCERLQICGHPCSFPCALVCPPCNRKCTTRCRHSRCNRNCGQTCQKCREYCQWRCRHLQCTEKCGNFCNRERCNVPCRRILKCGHKCISLCGEICPKLCRLCDRKKLTEFVIYGNEGDPNARFIQLQDCGHCIEVEALDYWMDMEDEEIQMKGCPRCKTTIWRSCRYGNAIKRRLIDIQKVKEKVFGDVKFLRRDMDKVYNSIKNDLTLKINFEDYVNRLEKMLTGKRALHQNQMMVIENQVKILKLMTTMLDKCEKSIKSAKAKDYLKSEIKNLSTRLMQNKEKIDEWELEAITKELRRVELWTTYIETENHIKSVDNPESKQHLADVYYLLSSSLTLTTDDEEKIEDLLKKTANLPGLGINVAERVSIVNAIGLSPGHWYKCPNGHVYVITECGGAMQQSKCNECGAEIGGEDHRLRGDNEVATEMDGATRPAYGEHVGIGNYDLGNLL